MPRRLILVIATLATTMTGCDLLSTRDPQPPTQQSNFLTATTPDVVLENFQNAVDTRDLAGYGRCFADSTHYPAGYHFTPAADAQAYATRFLSWGVADEKSYFLQLESQVPAAATLEVFIDSLQTEAAASDSTVYVMSYTLIANHTDPSRPTQARGRMHLTLKPDPITQLWAITQWVDVSNGVDPSWSVMKARFSP